MSALEESILHQQEAYQRECMARVRQRLVEAGRPDLLAEFDAKMRDIALGLDGARATWSALSEAQRRALQFADANRGRLSRLAKNYYGSKGALPAIRLVTVRNLIARELVACDGGAFDPEKVLVLTERGRFVLKRGPATN